MNAEFLAIVEYWEKEKGISRERLLQAVEEALLVSAKRAIGPARELRVVIDPKGGDIRAFARLVVVERVESKHDEISLADARRVREEIQLGEELEVEVTPKNFGRIAAQHARQALLQQVRRAEKELIFTEFKDRVGDIVSGVVRRFERSDVVVDLGKFEALLPNRERVPTEEYQVGDRIRCYVKDVEQTQRGHEIILSRADPQFVLKLFRLEVSEVADGTIEIKGIAREPGFRTKIAVYSRDNKVDPVGACVGLRGQRVKNIVRELSNEKVDIIPWSPDIRAFISAALSPAKLKTFKMDEPTRRVLIRCAPDQLSLAIGRRGQNTRLTERLTGWRISIEPEEDHIPGFADQVEHAVQEFARVPGIPVDKARILVNAGFHEVQDLLEVDVADLQELPGLEEAASTILEAARGEMVRRQAGSPEAPEAPTAI
jgi:transcription termination/antitermination protein NusA